VADDQGSARPPNWWQTTPGLLTGIAALITALTGLLIALHQTGVIGGRAPNAAAGAPAVPGSAAPAPETRKDHSPPAAAPPAAARASPAAPIIELPLPHAVTVGSVFVARFTVVSAAVEPRNAETWLVTFGVRMHNEARNAVNFWPNAFRLVADGAAQAPLDNFGAVVEGSSDSRVEAVQFVIARGATPSALRITHYNEPTEIAFGWKP
jgi:hypothetical protein